MNKEIYSHDRIKQGPITLQSGAVYTGEWKDGLRDGEGT